MFWNFQKVWTSETCWKFVSDLPTFVDVCIIASFAVILLRENENIIFKNNVYSG